MPTTKARLHAMHEERRRLHAALEQPGGATEERVRAYVRLLDALRAAEGLSPRGEPDMLELTQRARDDALAAATRARAERDERFTTAEVGAWLRDRAEDMDNDAAYGPTGFGDMLRKVAHDVEHKGIPR